MSPNFLPCERDQQLLMPTDLREWLPADHLAWFVLDTVAELDLGPSTAPIETTAGAGPPTTRR